MMIIFSNIGRSNQILVSQNLFYVPLGSFQLLFCRALQHRNHRLYKILPLTILDKGYLVYPLWIHTCPHRGA